MDFTPEERKYLIERFVMWGGGLDAHDYLTPETFQLVAGLHRRGLVRLETDYDGMLVTPEPDLREYMERVWQGKRDKLQAEWNR